MAFTLPQIPIAYLDVTFFDENQSKHVEPQKEQFFPFAVSQLFHAPIKSATYLTEGNDVKTVVEIYIDIKDSGFHYQPGQTIGILPQNNIEEVDEIINRLGIKDVIDKFYKVSIKVDCGKKNAKIPIHIPILGNIRETLINNIDIRSVPKKLFLRALTKYTTDENEIKILEELCSTQGSAKYTEFITKNFVTLLEILKTFKSCLPPISLLFEHLPRLQPRSYSIATSPNAPNLINSELSFVFSLEELPNSYEGVCTGWLHTILNKSSENKNKFKRIDFKNGIKIVSSYEKFEAIHVPVYLRKLNDFQLPDDVSIPIIMIAIGTGIAPFIGFLRHIEFLKKNYTNLNFGSVALFYGCRYSDRDFLFKTDLKHFVKSGVLTNFHLSCSRLINNAKYVQDAIVEVQEDFVKMLNEKANVYVCGNKKMCSDVFVTTINCLSQINKCSYEEGKNVLNDLVKQKKYVEDVWS